MVLLNALLLFNGVQLLKRFEVEPVLSVEDTVASVAVVDADVVVQPLGRLAVDSILVSPVEEFPLTEADELILVVNDGAHFSGGKNTRQ